MTSIAVTVHGCHGLVWRAEDVVTLRSVHRVVGRLIGVIPRTRACALGKLRSQLQCLSMPSPELTAAAA